MPVAEDLVYPRRLFHRCRRDHPELNHFMDEAEMSTGAMDALADMWRRNTIDDKLPLAGRPLSLHVRCAMFATLATLRSVDLTEGLARELESDALFPAASIARSSLELVGLTASARQRIPEAAAEPTDVRHLHVVTFRYLLGSRQLSNVGLPTHFSIPDLVGAAKEQLGDHFGEDYGLLSDVSHPARRRQVRRSEPNAASDGRPPVRPPDGP